LAVTNTLTDARAIEQRLLDLAYTTDVKITAPALAYHAPCSIEDAATVLDDLAARGRVSMDVQDDGSIVYEVLGRQRMSPPRPALAPAIPRAMVHAPRRPWRDASPAVAAALSLFVPGAGHLYAGRVMAAFLWFLVVGAGYALILPGLILHLFSMASAAAAAARVSAPRQTFLLRHA
jgi:hypothetical protein